MRQHCRSENVLYSYVRRSKHSEDNCHWAAALEASRRHAPAENNDASVAITSTHGGGAARRLRVGLKAGPKTAACLEAGNRGEAFACLFQAHAIFLHQACADGSVFFCRRLSKAGLSESTQHTRLILDPSSPVPTCTARSWAVSFNNMQTVGLLYPGKLAIGAQFARGW